MREPLGRVRQLEVDDQADVVDIDPPRGNVGGDEDLAPAIAKRSHRPVADGLRQVALELDGVVAELAQVAVELRHPVLGAAEHDRAAAVTVQNAAQRL